MVSPAFLYGATARRIITILIIINTYYYGIEGEVKSIVLSGNKMRKEESKYTEHTRMCIIIVVVVANRVERERERALNKRCQNIN